MTGRLALLILAGVVATFIALNASMSTSDAIDDFVKYDSRSNAYDIAMSGANLAANTLYFNKWFRGTYKDNVDYNGGRLSVDVETVGGGVRVTSVGTYPASGPKQVTQQVVYYLSPGYYDRFVVLTDNDPGNIPWTTYDTANGNLHSNNTLLMDHYAGSTIMPVFNGKVTAAKPFIITPGTYPVFTQIPQTGLTVQLPTNFDPVSDPPFLPGSVNWGASYTINNGQTLTSTNQLHLQFYVDGTGQQMVRYFRYDKRLTNNGYGDFRASDTVVPAPASGIIYETGEDVFVEGVVKGKLSVMSVPDGLGHGGNVFVTNDLTCATDPKQDPSSGDYIGLLAYNNVVIANTMNDQATVSGSNRFTVEASLVALTGGLTSADNITRKRQALDIYGCVIQSVRKGVGSGSSAIGSATGGFMKKYYYDARLLQNHALLMPQTPLFALDSYLVKGVY